MTHPPWKVAAAEKESERREEGRKMERANDEEGKRAHLERRAIHPAIHLQNEREFLLDVERMSEIHNGEGGGARVEGGYARVMAWSWVEVEQRRAVEVLNFQKFPCCYAFDIAAIIKRKAD